ncbi:ATP-binding protein [Halopseudomonas phragmitis]|uniref:histidine kinase n=2 Tax=Pseudomonadaceae TaxID=135621 RepID=A0A1V0B3Q5_9GAMM|nr:MULTISPECIES: ATP-binding protein [Pseudomonadaceae]AQZ94569.1 ATPase [Halopseudomonas phragmitis]RHW22226.1 CBS domain-containing protein [Pseudomonas jilinensis]
MPSQTTLAGLRKAVEPLSASLTINDVADRLLESGYKGFLSLPVVDERNRPLGLVSRYRLQDIFMQRFGRDLWGRHSILEATNRQSLIVDLDTPLDQAARIITGQLQYPITEDFILTDAHGRYAGLGTVMDLLRAMEVRIGQRNQALRRALKQLKESQSHLVQSEKMASLGQMVAGVAHELNTPLGYVKNNVQLLASLVQPVLELAQAQAQLMQALDAPQRNEAELAQLFEQTRQAAELAAPEQLADDLNPLLEDTLFGLAQIAELAVSLKDFARLDRAMSEAVDINDCVRSALLIARNAIKDKAEVITRLGELPPITCTPSQINQVLLNLLTNAAQAMDHPGQILIRSWTEHDRVYLSIQDNGKGIPKELQNRIFDPFFTTKSVGQGTGLGLSISYQIIRDHAGQIRFVSEPGRGTRFVISLPLTQPQVLQRSA